MEHGHGGHGGGHGGHGGHDGHGGEHHGPGAELFALMAARRSCKRFTPRPVELDKLLQIVQAGTLAPSSGNIQNWTFIVVTDVDIIRKLYHASLDQEPFLSAMAAVVVVADVNYANMLYGMRGKRLYSVQNCAAAMQNMLLAATALGLGTSWIGAFDEDTIIAQFGIPGEKFRPQAVILFGYPDAEPEPKTLRPLDNMVYFNRFGSRVKRPHLIYFDWATEWEEMGKKLRHHLAWAKWSAKRSREKPAHDDAHATAVPPQVGNAGHGSAGTAGAPHEAAHGAQQVNHTDPHDNGGSDTHGSGVASADMHALRRGASTRDQIHSKIKRLFDGLKKDEHRPR